MRSPLLVAALCVALLPAAVGRAGAQTPDSSSGPTLTLDEAIALALKNNPGHLEVLNARRTAGARLRSAYGALLPTADASFTGQYLQQGQTIFNGASLGANSDIYQSQYFLGLNYRINAATFINPKLQSANVSAAEADVAGSRELVRANVANQYLTALQSQARAELQDSLVRSAELQLALAKARFQVGSGTQLDVTRAEVTLGQAQVAAIQGRNQVEIDKLRLFQQMGVKQPANVQLTSRFEVTEPTFTLDSVLALAHQQNPTLNAMRKREKSAAMGVRAAQADYLPTLSLQTGWGGYTFQYTNDNFPVQQATAGVRSCLAFDSLRVGAGLAPSGGCGSLMPDGTLPPAQAAAIRAANNQFPFDFTKQPWQLTATLSLPLFDGFAREQRVQEAQASRNDARYREKQQELQLTGDVTSAYLTLKTQAQTVALQQRNAEGATEELRLAEERYRVGAATFLDVSDARASYERAQNDLINSVYEYHKAFAALESAVGRPLR